MIKIFVVGLLIGSLFAYGFSSLYDAEDTSAPPVGQR